METESSSNDYDGLSKREWQHQWQMENLPGYRRLIEKGLTPDEADYFISLAAVEYHAPCNLEENDKKDLAALRERIKDTLS